MRSARSLLVGIAVQPQGRDIRFLACNTGMRGQTQFNIDCQNDPARPILQDQNDAGHFQMERFSVGILFSCCSQSKRSLFGREREYAKKGSPRVLGTLAESLNGMHSYPGP